MALVDLDSIAGNDEALQAHIRARRQELIDAVFDQAMETIKNGDMSSQTAVMKVILPMIMNASKKDEEGTTDAMIMKKEALEALREIGAAIEEFGGSPT